MAADAGADNLLVLDMDGTLVYSSRKERPCDFEVRGRRWHFYVQERPCLKEFLDTIRPHYRLWLWTAASKEYASQVIGCAGLDGLLSGAFFGDRCTRRMDHETFEEFHVKKLRKIRRDLSKVIIVDDEPRKCSYNYGNAIYVPPFEGQKEDDVLPCLARYLLRIKDASDFRTVEKRRWLMHMRKEVDDDIL